MLQVDTNPSNDYYNHPSLLTTASYDMKPLSDIHPRVCTLHKWSHYDGYGIHLSRNEKWIGLRIDEVESYSPAESGGLLCEDIVLAVNGRSIENDDFFTIVTFIENELEKDQIRFLVLDPNSAELAQNYQININEDDPNCIRMETAEFIASSKTFIPLMAKNSSQDKLDDITNLQSDISPNNNLQLEPRMYTVFLRPGTDSIGISLRSDADFGHIITQVELDSPAGRAGMEQNDCIISLNNTILLHIAFEDVLYFLKKSRNETKLDFLVAKKSYLFKSSPTNNDILLSSNLTERKKLLTRSTTQTFKEFYKQREAIATLKDEQYDYLCLQIYSNPCIVKHKKHHGKILKGIGPATAHRLSWSVSSEKTIDYSSIRSALYDRIMGTDEAKMRKSAMKNAFSSLQIGITNPSPTQKARQIPVRNFGNNGQRSAQSSSSSSSPLRWFYNSSKVTPSPNLTIRSNHVVNTPSPVLKQNHNTTTSAQQSPALRFRKPDNSQLSQYNLHLATTPISQLSNHGYELHHIKLMQPSETIPIGFTLTKQTNPVQYIIPTIDEQSKADIAGLKADDWLIQIEDNDIRLTDLYDVSQDIQRLLNNAGFINLLIARKKSSTYSPTIDDQQTSDIPDKTNALLSVGLSNPIENENFIHPTKQYNDIDKDKIRRITLKEPSGLYYDSFELDDNDQTQFHFVKSIQPISAAYRAGLRNGDRILTVNDVDVTKTGNEDVRLMIIKEKPVEITVINDPKYKELIENFKRIQNPPINNESTDQLKDLKTVLFIDSQGPIYVKHCIVKKEPGHDLLGFLLFYEDNVHVIKNVESNSPAYNNGLRDDDVILFINKTNIQLMSHDDLTNLFRSLALPTQSVNLLLISKNDVQRYNTYRDKNLINWKKIFSGIRENQKKRRSDINQRSDNSQETATSSLLAGARICVLETSTSHPAGFTISGIDPPPYTISKIEKDSPAEKAGLQLDDALLSINGKSVMETSYEDTVKIVKEALQQQIIQFVVNQLPTPKIYHPREGSQSSSTSDSYGDSDSQNSNNNNGIEEPSRRGGNAIEQYQRQRTKELSYSVRICHLNATNADGAPPSTFGFEISDEPEYEYPVISRVEPKLPGERAGLQTRDILIKVNNRKTKGSDFEKVKRSIDKAKRDGRLEMLVVDKEAFDYCIRTNRKFKEPYIKVKHIFPRSRSSATFQRLPSIAALSQENIERSTSVTFGNANRLSMQSVNEEDAVNNPIFEATTDFDIPLSMSPSNTAGPYFPSNAPFTFIDPERKLSQRRDTDSTIRSMSNTPQGMQSEASNQSVVDFVLNTINKFFQSVGSEKSTKPDYDILPERTNNTKTHKLSPSTIGVAEVVRDAAQSNNTVRSNQSSGSYDYIQDPRRCVLEIDHNKGLGFVLSANNDYDHTITAVDKNSIAAGAGLQINDEVVEVNDVDVRNMKYEQVVEMLISIMRTNNKVELSVINNRLSGADPSATDKNNGTNTHNLLNGNNDNNLITVTATLGDDLVNKNNTTSPVDGLHQRKTNVIYRNLEDQPEYLQAVNDHGLSGSVPTFTTGITGSPKDLRSTKTTSNSSKTPPVARLCRIRKFPSSPFYGFFLCGNPKKLGRVFVSDIAKNSPASVCGLRDGDHIIEVNGTNIETLTYETILGKIKLHMDRHDLELLVLDKKSLRWYRERNYPITSRTLPTIVHIEPIMNNINTEIQTKPVDIVDRRVSTTSL